MHSLALSIVLLGICACAFSAPTASPSPVPAQAAPYFDSTGGDDVLSGDVKLIPISTPCGTFAQAGISNARWVPRA